MTGDYDIRLRPGEFISEKMDDEANVKWGARLLPNYDGKLEIVAIVTGVTGSSIMGKYNTSDMDRGPVTDIEVIG